MISSSGTKALTTQEKTGGLLAEKEISLNCDISSFKEIKITFAWLLGKSYQLVCEINYGCDTSAATFKKGPMLTIWTLFV